MIINKFENIHAISQSYIFMPTCSCRLCSGLWNFLFARFRILSFMSIWCRFVNRFSQGFFVFSVSDKVGRHATRLSKVQSRPGPGQFFRTWTWSPRFSPLTIWTWTWTSVDPVQKVRARSSPGQDLAPQFFLGMNIIYYSIITI